MDRQLFRYENSSTLHIYQVGGRTGHEKGNQPMTEWQSKTLQSLLWGLIRQDLSVENCSLADGTRTGIEELKIERSLGQRAAMILTLGFWSPLKVSWRCAKPLGPRGKLD